MVKRMQRRGVVLLVVIGMTSILGALGATYATVARIERNVSANYVDKVRAAMLATSGVDAAMARLRLDAAKRMFDTPTDAWAWPGGAVPLDQAVTPSYAAGTLTVDGQTRGYSGALPGTYDPLGDTYALRITDLGGCLNLNGNETHLAAMLDALGRGIALLGGKADPIHGRGAQVLAARNSRFGGQFRSLDDLLVVLTRTERDTLGEYVTLCSWVDRGVVEPTPQDRATWPVESYDFKLTRPDATGQPSGRPPVNLNTAPLPVLFACLSGISARIVRANLLVDVPPLTDRQAGDVARAIDKARLSSPFRTWDDFETWCYKGLPKVTSDQIAVIVANADPNTRLNKFVPDTIGLDARGRPYTRTADKTDLTFHTTEFSFSSFGWFRIESLGRLLDSRHVTVASAKVDVVVKLYDVIRQSSQRDFVEGAGGSGGFHGTRSFPENMENQRWETSRASAVAGEVQIKEDDALEGDETFSLDNDDTLCARASGYGVQARWYSSVYDSNRKGRMDEGPNGQRDDLYENRPADEGMPYVPVRAPLDRSVTNAAMAPSYRNSAFASDLLPDGCLVSRRRKRVNLQPAVNAYTRKGLANPAHSVVEWWTKKDLRGGWTKADSLEGMYLQMVPGAAEQIGTATSDKHDIYEDFIDANSMCFHHVSRLIGNSCVLPQSRKAADFVYPFDRDYACLGNFPNFRGYDKDMDLPAGQWDQLRIEQDNFTTVRFYVDGRLNLSATAYWYMGGSTSSTFLDVTQIGHVWWHFWSGYSCEQGSDRLIDTVRMYGSVTAGRSHPYRYPVSQGGAFYEGSINLQTVLPAGRAATLLDIGYTQVRPKVLNVGGAYVRLADPPYAALEFQAPGGAWTSGGKVGDGAAINQRIMPGQKLRYRLRFFDNGLTPNNAAAHVEDVTVFCTTGPQIMSWTVDTQ